MGDILENSIIRTNNVAVKNPDLVIAGLIIGERDVESFMKGMVL
tara:strand:- start:941 stop:1072 length:132 start_codon:yes stop_codon:yes gene_type:complete